MLSRQSLLMPVLCVLFASHAAGDSVVEFSLGLQNAGGAYADYVGAYPSQLYPAGSQAGGQTYTVGDAITWNMTLEAYGVQTSGNGAGYEIQGVANFVYNLELHAGDAGGPLVGTDVFYSAVNDGSSGRLASAAFSRSMHADGNGPGRVIDSILNGGPFMNVYSYPANPGDGTLFSMGAGYAWWDRGGGSSMTTHGVGIDGSPFGIVPVTEGQIDTSLLSPGMYTLLVNPGAGVNVLRGDIDLTQNQDAFAVGADRTMGGAITFTLVPEPTTGLLLVFGGLLLLGRRQRSR